MNNKVLIKLIIPELNKSYDIFIPVNELVWKIIKLITKSISDLTGGALDLKGEYILLNSSLGKVYKNNDIIIDTEIRNSTELILLQTNKTILSTTPIQNTQNINSQQGIVQNNKQININSLISNIPITKDLKN